MGWMDFFFFVFIGTCLPLWLAHEAGCDVERPVWTILATIGLLGFAGFFVAGLHAYGHLGSP